MRSCARWQARRERAVLPVWRCYTEFDSKGDCHERQGESCADEAHQQGRLSGKVGSGRPRRCAALPLAGNRFARQGQAPPRVRNERRCGSMGNQQDDGCRAHGRFLHACRRRPLRVRTRCGGERTFGRVRDGGPSPRGPKPARSRQRARRRGCRRDFARRRRHGACSRGFRGRRPHDRR